MDKEKRAEQLRELAARNVRVGGPRASSEPDNSRLSLSLSLRRIVVQKRVVLPGKRARPRDSGSKCHERLSVVERVRVKLGFSSARVYREGVEGEREGKHRASLMILLTRTGFSIISSARG